MENINPESKKSFAVGLDETRRSRRKCAVLVVNIASISFAPIWIVAAALWRDFRGLSVVMICLSLALVCFAIAMAIWTNLLFHNSGNPGTNKDE